MSFEIRRIGEEPPAKRWKKRAAKAAAFGLMVARPAVQLFAKHKEMKEEEERSEHRAVLLKRIALVLLTLLGSLVVLVVLVRVLIAMHILSAQSVLSMTSSPLPTDTAGRTNILLLGQGDINHDGVDLTDTMMIASIDPKNTKSVMLLSIPRDLELYNIPGIKDGRINELYRDRKNALIAKGMSVADAEQQGMKEAADTLGQLTGVQIQRVVKVDFTGFVEAVDAVGGVDVDVPETIVDTEYPSNETGGIETYMITKGPHHLDGEAALKYVRSRHTTSDFGRSARQQQLLSAMSQKMKEQGMLGSPATLLKLIDIANHHVQTTMTFGEIAGLAGIGNSLDHSRIITMQLNFDNGLYGGIPAAGGFLYPPPREQFGGASVLLPVSIPAFPVTWKQISSFVTMLMDHRDLYLPPLRVDIRNVSAPSGSAQKIGAELIRYGLDVTKTGNAPKDSFPAGMATSRIILPKADEKRGKELSDLLGIPAGTDDATAILPDADSGSILILLGKDYSYTPIQDLLKPPTP